MAARIPLSGDLAARGFTVREGRLAGLGAGRLRGPDLSHPFRGIRLPGGVDTRLDLCLALQRRLPATAWISGSTAALILGVPLPRGLEDATDTHVSVTAPARAPTGRGIRGHSCAVDDVDIRLWRGLRMSSPERIWCELAAHLDLLDLVAAGDYLVHEDLPFTSIARLGEAVARFTGRRGLPLLREATPLLVTRSESRRESQLRATLVRGDISGLEVNLPIVTTAGYRYRADLAVPSKKVVIEYQGGYHHDPAQYRRDMTRRSRLEADGWFVIEVNADDLRDPLELVSRIRRVLATRVDIR